MALNGFNVINNRKRVNKMKTQEEFKRNLCLNEAPEKVFMVVDNKSIYEDDAYREVVLQRGDDVVDIVYNRGAFRAKSDMASIKTELITYGYDRAKELALYLKELQANFEKRLSEERY